MLKYKGPQRPPVLLEYSELGFFEVTAQLQSGANTEVF